MGSKKPVAYTINHEGFKLDLAIMYLDDLHLHEEIIPDKINGLKQSILRTGLLETPVIIDKNSYVVLDGMHRVNVLRMLNHRFISVCMVDYFDDRISLGRWCRTINHNFNSNQAIEIFADMGYKLKSAVGMNPLTNPDLFVVFGSSCFYVEDDNDLISISKLAYDFELKLINNGYFVGHSTEDESSILLASGKISAIICPPLISKEQVVQTAINHKVFAPKATRHKLPAKPLGACISLNLLNDPELNLEEVNIKFRNILNEKKLVKLPPGSIFSGKKYEETVYVFN